MAEEALAVLSGIASAYSDKKYTDLEIRCRGKTWAAHKLVLCTQSQFFRQACDGKFRKSISSKISLDDDEPEVVDAMLSFLYTRDYKEGIPKRNPMTFQVQVFLLADKYFIESLKKHTVQFFQAYTGHKWAEQWFAEAIREVYKAGPPAISVMQDIILRTVTENITELYKREAELTAFHDVLSTVPDFTLDVNRALAHRIHNQSEAEAAHILPASTSIDARVVH